MNIRILAVCFLVVLGIYYNIESIGYTVVLLLVLTRLFYQIFQRKIPGSDQEGSTVKEELQRLQSAYQKQQITEVEYRRQRDILVREYNKGVNQDER
ncbi:MAG: hypothetical protein E7191_06300 [Erysipelotrichaceae bacterium]|nr:hypothetical protein [Erysipelotrichaceae bacterium]MBR3693921.1 hypothetical protein [Erysipelotrichales bacterium]